MSPSSNFNEDEQEPSTPGPRSGSPVYNAADAGRMGDLGSVPTDEHKNARLQAGIADGGRDRNNSDGYGDRDEGGLPKKRQGSASVFSNRYFMLLWLTQALTQTAQHTLNLALVDFVNKLSKGSSTQTAIVIIAFVLPGVFFSALAGAFVDRVNKRTILIITNVLRAVIIPGLVFMDAVPLAVALPLIFLITCLFSTFSQFFAPAEGAMIPYLVEEKHLTQANSLFQVTVFATQFLGFSLLGPILPRLIGSQNLFLVIAAIFGVSIFLTTLLPSNLEKDRSIVADDTRSMIVTLWNEIKEGWKFIRANRPIWLSIIYLSTVQSVLFSLTTIGIPYVSSKTQGLGLPESDIIFILAPLSIGLGIGVWLVNMLVTPRNRSKAMLVAVFVLGLNLILIGLLKPIAEFWSSIFSPGVPIGGPGLIMVMVAISLPFGFQVAFLNIPALTILQEKSPKEIVGRVFAAYFTFANLVSIFPILFAGAMGDLIGLVPTFFLIGLSVLGVAFYGYRERQK